MQYIADLILTIPLFSKICLKTYREGISFNNGYIPEDGVMDLEVNAHLLKRIVRSLAEAEVDGLDHLEGWRKALEDPSTMFTLTTFKRKRKQNVKDAESRFSPEIINFFEENGSLDKYFPFSVLTKHRDGRLASCAC